MQVRQRNLDLAVEPTRTQQRRVEGLGTVRGGEDDDTRRWIEAVHLREQLVEGLLAFVVLYERAASPLADRVDLVNEDDRRRRLARGVEQIANARGADTDEEFDEARPGEGEERNVRLAGDGPRQQRLAAAGRPDHEYAARRHGADGGVTLGMLQEIDNFADLALRAMRPPANWRVARRLIQK